MVPPRTSLLGAFSTVFFTPVTVSMLFGFALRCFGQWAFIKQLNQDHSHFSHRHPTSLTAAAPAPPAPVAEAEKSDESDEEDDELIPTLIDMYGQLALPEPAASEPGAESESEPELFAFLSAHGWFEVGDDRFIE